MFYCRDVIQKIKLGLLRKKIMNTAKFLITNKINIADMEIFKAIDENYNRFLGCKKNLNLSLILHNKTYNKQM